MKTMMRMLGAMTLVGMGMAIGWAVKPASAEAEAQKYVYELRTYTTEEGKLPALNARFRDHTVKLFEKHGIKNVIYLTPIDEKGKAVDNKLVYLLAHKSQDAAKASFGSFLKDPDWNAAREASEKDGKILAKPPESQFYVPTDYSPLK
jgi:hypothetical protein